MHNRNSFNQFGFIKSNESLIFSGGFFPDSIFFGFNFITIRDAVRQLQMNSCQWNFGLIEKKMIFRFQLFNSDR